jgi:hypothetical protein
VKSAREQLDILSAYQELGSFRAVAALCGTMPKTVRRVIERRSRPSSPRRPRPKSTDAFANLIAQRVRATDGRISAKRLLITCQAAGYGGWFHFCLPLCEMDCRAGRLSMAGADIRL